MAYEFWNPKPEELFWECGCTKPDWQNEFNGPNTDRNGILGRHRQVRCTNCLQVAKFFRQTREEQAAQVKDLLGRTAMMSSWLAVSIGGPMASIPRDVCKKVAGWDKLDKPSEKT